MIHKRHNLFAGLGISSLALVAFALLGTGWVTTTYAQTAPKSAHSSALQQPLYGDYRGVRIGMNAQDVRTKLGAPHQKADDMDLYVFSETEAAQIAYDVSHKVKAVSVDYMGGTGAPEYKSVVGPDVEANANGAIYKLVRYESLGFWVSYHRSAGTVPMVTITIQKIL